MTADEILMQEFATMREELLLQVKNTKLHLKHALAFLGAALAVVWYVFFVQGAAAEGLTKALDIQKSDLTVLVVFALDILSFYFAFDILDSYYCLFLAAARLASIEKQVNEIIRPRLMVWESQFAKHSISMGWSRVTITIYQLVLVFAVSCGLPLWAYYRLLQGPLTWPILPCIFMAIAVIFFCWFSWCFIDVFVIRRKGARRIMDDIVAGKITVPDDA
jgi:hypothetical protein